MKVNLGCGAIAPSGWVNIDRSPGLILDKVPGLRHGLGRMRLIPAEQASAQWPDNVRHHDVTKGLPFGSGTVQAIYSSHMLEHVPRDTAVAILRECRRVLAPGGSIRAAVPDIRALAEAYLADDSPDAADRFIRDSWMGIEHAPRGSAKIVQLVSGARHKWMYDQHTLAALFAEGGFPDTEPRTYRDSDIPDIASVEHRPESIFIEGKTV